MKFKKQSKSNEAPWVVDSIVLIPGVITKVVTYESGTSKCSVHSPRPTSLQTSLLFISDGRSMNLLESLAYDYDHFSTAYCYKGSMD